jgi:hypothetical protein
VLAVCHQAPCPRGQRWPRERLRLRNALRLLCSETLSWVAGRWLSVRALLVFGTDPIEQFSQVDLGLGNGDVAPPVRGPAFMPVEVNRSALAGLGNPLGTELVMADLRTFVETLAWEQNRDAEFEAVLFSHLQSREVTVRFVGLRMSCVFCRASCLLSLCVRSQTSWTASSRAFVSLRLRGLLARRPF